MDDDHQHEPSRPAGWRPGRWWAWSGASFLMGAAVVTWAGMELASSPLGTSLRARGCNADVVGAIAALLAGSLLVLIGMTLVNLHRPGTVICWSAHALTLTIPVPVLLLGMTIPGAAGCRAARDLAGLPIVGDAFVGASGIVLAGAACSLTAAAIAGCLVVTGGSDQPRGDAEAVNVVDRAIAAAEAFGADPASQRFRGVE